MTGSDATLVALAALAATMRNRSPGARIVGVKIVGAAVILLRDHLVRVGVLNAGVAGVGGHFDPRRASCATLARVDYKAHSCVDCARREAEQKDGATEDSHDDCTKHGLVGRKILLVSLILGCVPR